MGEVVYDFAKQLAYLKTILKHLAISTKCVEDDTSFGRIIQSIKVVLHHNRLEVAGYFDNESESVFSLCSFVFNSLHCYSSSKSFAMKLFGLFSSFDRIMNNLSNKHVVLWHKSLNILTSITINDETTPSILFSWLQSLNCIVCSELGMKAMIVNGSVFGKIFNMSTSLFLFVQKEAISLVCKIWMFLCAPDTGQVLQENNSAPIQLSEVLTDFNEHLLSTTLDVLLGILTKCCQSHGTNMKYIPESDLIHLKNLLQTKFRDNMIQQARMHKAVFVNFLVAATVTSFEFLDMEYTVELAFTGLLQNPRKRFGYIVLLNVAQSDEYWKKNFPQLLNIPVHLSLGKKLCTSHLENWSEAVTIAMKHKSHLTEVLCNCCYFWPKIFANETFEISKKEIIECIVILLCCAFEVNMSAIEAEKVYCHLFQNKRVGFSAVGCLQGCVKLAQQNGDCVLCLNPSLYTTLIAVMNSPESDEKVISKAGHTVSTSITSIVSCPMHGKNVKHYIHSLLDCAMTKCNNSHWEIRDSAFEVLVKCVHSTKGKVSSVSKMALDSNIEVKARNQILGEFGALSLDSKEVFADLDKTCTKLELFNTVLSGLVDKVSFVRSSALKLATEMLQLTNFPAKNEIFTKTCHILQSDTEAFARRTAMQVLASMICQTDKLCQEFLTYLCANSNETKPTDDDIDVSLANLAWRTFKNYVLVDLDWEVRLNAVRFMEKIYKTIQPDYFGNLEVSMCSLLQPLATCEDCALEESAKKLQHILTNKSETGFNDAFAIQENVRFAANELQDLLVEVVFLVTDGDHTSGASLDGNVLPTNLLDCY